MARKYEKYIVDEPKIITDYLYHGEAQRGAFSHLHELGVGSRGPRHSAMSSGEPNFPRPNPTCEIHHHPKPQLLMFVGAEDTFEVEVPLNDELYTFTKTTAIWIPAGVDHNVKYNRIDAPMMGNRHCDWAGTLQLKIRSLAGAHPSRVLIQMSAAPPSTPNRRP